MLSGYRLTPDPAKPRQRLSGRAYRWPPSRSGRPALGFAWAVARRHGSGVTSQLLEM